MTGTHDELVVVIMIDSVCDVETAFFGDTVKNKPVAVRWDVFVARVFTVTPIANSLAYL